ncbi:uncharacterized protein TNCV_3028821 [Trichonephila clavipes]|nr:uncharacterized protein TNCV_3028821 [Trichonephila clavipes]
MQEETTDRRDPLHPPQCTIAVDDRQIVCMAIMNCAIMNYSPTDLVCLSSFGIRLYFSTPFAAEWNVRKTSIASFTLDWKPQAFAPPVVQGTADIDNEMR